MNSSWMRALSFVLAVVGAVVLANGAAMANEPHTPSIVEPRFETVPSADDLSNYFPPGANAAKVEGDAVLQCIVAINHRLEGCVVKAENPVGFGFGDAALKLSSLFRVAPKMVDGVPRGGESFTTRIRFKLPDMSVAKSASVANYVIYVPWVNEPTSEQITAAYPTSASGPGMAVLICATGSDGDLRDCHLEAEYPKNMGFGEAAFTLAPLYTAGPPHFTPGPEPLAAQIEIIFYPPARQTPIPTPPSSSSKTP